MATLFDSWTLQDARDAVAKAIEGTVGLKGFEENRRFVEERDHWQDGAGWVGPGHDLPEPLRTSVLEKVRAQFTPIDAIGEILERFANGLMKREADLAFAPRTEVEPGTPEAEELSRLADGLRTDVSVWWDRVKLWQLARAALIRSRWAGRGALRVWIAPGSLVASGDGSRALPEFETLAEALEHVQLEAPPPEACCVFTDPETRETVGIVLHKRDGQDAAELSYVDPDSGETVLRVVVGDKTVDETRIDLGGRLPIVELQGSVLISEPVRALQRKLNYLSSLHLRTAETAGFPERYIANAEPEGVWLPTPPPDGEPAAGTMEGENGTLYLHARPRTLGASVVTELRGIEDADGRVQTPSVTFRDPTDPEYVARAAQATKVDLLHNCHQGHIAYESQGQSSGVAYQQARSDFEADLASARSGLESLIRDTIEAAIALGEAMLPARESSVLDRLRASVNCYVNAGPVTPDEQAQILEQWKNGLISRADALARLGVEDVAAAFAALEADPLAKVHLVKAKAEALQALTAAGAGIYAAALLAGFSEEEARLLQREDWVDGIDQ